MSSRKGKKADKEMALSGHLKELRNRIVICLLCLVITFAVCLFYAPQIVEFLTDIGKTYGYRYVYISPQELLMQHFSLALLSAVCVTFPVILYQVWAFIRPGLRRKENLLFVLAVVFGLLCFLAGVYFAYRVMLPFMLEFLIGVSAGTDIQSAITVGNYIAFLLTMFVIFGVIFELPVASVLLTQLGLLKVEWMKKGTRVMVVVIFFLAAVITPPDVVSQIMVAIPMIALYELSIFLSAILMKVKKRLKKKQDEADEDTEDEE